MSRAWGFVALAPIQVVKNQSGGKVRIEAKDPYVYRQVGS
jgi:hypothetical protein